MTSGNLAQVYQSLGQRTAARTTYEAAAAALHDLGDRSSEARLLANLADMLVEEGDLQKAWDLSSQAMTLHRAIGEAAGISEDQGILGRVLLLRGDLPAAQRDLEAAVAGLDALGAKLSAARHRILLAQILVAAGQPEKGEALAQVALAGLGTSPDDEVEARSVRAAAALARGRNDIATAEVRRTVEALGACENLTVRLDAMIVAARVHAAAGRREEALRDLRTAQSEAERIGLKPLALEARLALGTIESAAGDAAGPERLAAVARDAAAAGLGGIARRATASNIALKRSGGPS
jgi:tetratricopeptide (TPR) repeat protein